MLQQLRTVNRFVSLTPNDPDDSDTDTEPTEPPTVDKPHDDGSAVSDDTVPTSKQGLNLSCVLVCLFVCLPFWFVLCLMGLLTGLCIGPLPALLRLSTDRRPCMIIYNSSFCCG